MIRFLIPLFLLGLVLPFRLSAQTPAPEAAPAWEDKFRQLYEILPTPNAYRNGAGMPGHQYWQNRADYDMDIRLDDTLQRIYGTETITYHNASPDVLYYFWLQLDQNMRAPDSDTYKVRTGPLTEGEDGMSFRELAGLHQTFDGGFKIEWVQDAEGKPLPYTINRTMMRVDLPRPLEPGQSYAFRVKWWYNINERAKVGGRSGFEYFPEDDNYLYTIAQFFPRMCQYNDIDGWQNKQFLGRGEFTLPFGDYRVRLTVPADHVVAATGTLENARQVLTLAQRNRLAEAMTAADPVLIITEAEARAAETARSTREKTWLYQAQNVRDFAFASSRKFMWDAQGVPMGGRTVLAMSYYPKEGNPLWERYSTRAVAHTLRVYSRHTFDYPYPVAISVHTDRIGMEYPMICFNGGRPEPDGTYSERTKYGLISVVIHEVGHNYFPMIVNSDERQWTWMDEGLNTFLQYIAEQEWEPGYPSRRGPAYKIVDYMRGAPEGMVPIMTNSESVMQFGNNAYAKPATALNILRETILGRELFDFAFKQYAQRWMFKEPSPADFFRLMEDASGTDLDWFWHGWFYTTDHVDIALDEVRWYQIDTRNPDVERPLAQQAEAAGPTFIGDTRNAGQATLMDEVPELADFYNQYDPYAVSILDRQEYEAYLARLDADEKALLERDDHYYELHLSNRGGLVMPVILSFTYADGSQEVHRIPAEVWRMNPHRFAKVFVTEQPITGIVVDPFLETADTDTGNNYWPPRVQPTRFQLFKQGGWEQENPMQRARRAVEAEGQTPPTPPGDRGKK